MSLKELSLKKDERLVRVVRRYPLTYAAHIVLTIGCIGSAFFFMFWLFRHGWWGQGVFFLLIASGIVLAALLFFDHYKNVCYITTQRLFDIDRRGFFHCVVSEIPYDQIEDVSGHISGFFGTLFRFGHVHIQTAGGTVRVVIELVKQPTRLQQLINSMRERYVSEVRKPISRDAIARWIAEAESDDLDYIQSALDRRV